MTRPRDRSGRAGAVRDVPGSVLPDGCGRAGVATSGRPVERGRPPAPVRRPTKLWPAALVLWPAAVVARQPVRELEPRHAARRPGVTLRRERRRVVEAGERHVDERRVAPVHEGERRAAARAEPPLAPGRGREDLRLAPGPGEAVGRPRAPGDHRRAGRALAHAAVAEVGAQRRPLQPVPYRAAQAPTLGHRTIPRPRPSASPAGPEGAALPALPEAGGYRNRPHPGSVGSGPPEPLAGLAGDVGPAEADVLEHRLAERQQRATLAPPLEPGLDQPEAGQQQLADRARAGGGRWKGVTVKGDHGRAPLLDHRFDPEDGPSSATPQTIRSGPEA